MTKKQRKRRRLDHRVYSRESFLRTVFHRTEKQVLTNEDWYPTVEGKICVSLHHDRRYNQKLREYGPVFAWRVAIWGGDDMGMDQSFDSLGAAENMFKRIVDLTTMAQLVKWGFSRA